MCILVVFPVIKISDINCTFASMELFTSLLVIILMSLLFLIIIVFFVFRRRLFLKNKNTYHVLNNSLADVNLNP